jgi:hypothetical protein
MGITGDSFLKRSIAANSSSCAQRDAASRNGGVFRICAPEVSGLNACSFMLVSALTSQYNKATIEKTDNMQQQGTFVPGIPGRSFFEIFQG